MRKLQHFKVATLPASPQADSIYFVGPITNKGVSFTECYVTDQSGNAKMVGNTSLVNSLIDEKIAQLERTKVVATITARGALTPIEGDEVYVLDASADPTVESGAAKYIYDGSNWHKVSEAESLDFDIGSASVAWNNITGKPNSTPAQIDDAVSKRHSHTNKPTLDNISEKSGVLEYNNDPVVRFDVAEW